MNQCTKCGAAAGEGAVFCTRCGERLPAPGPEQIPATRQDTAEKETSPGKVAVFGIITFGVYWAFWISSVTRTLNELRGTHARPWLQGLLVFFAVSPVGFWIGSIVSGALLGPLALVYSLAAVCTGIVVLSGTAKEIQKLYQTAGYPTAIRHPTGFAVAAEFVPFVILFFAARMQSELSRYRKILSLNPEELAVGEKMGLLKPQPIASVSIAVAAMVGVLLICGILAAIAIPQFASFKTQGNNAAARAGLHNMRTCVEAFYSDHYEYPASIEELAKTDSSCGQVSQGVQVKYEKFADGRYRMTSSHPQGNKDYLVKSEEAGMFIRNKDNVESAWEPL